MIYYLYNPQDGSYRETKQPVTESNIDNARAYAQTMGLKLMTLPELNAVSGGSAAASLRQQGVELGQLASDYAREPEKNINRMKQYGFDPLPEGASGLGSFGSLIAPATSYSVESQMGPAGVLGAAGLDLASMVLGGGAPGAVSRTLGAKGVGALGRLGGSVAADAALGAAASGAQQGYGRGGFDPTAAKVGAIVGGGLGGVGGSLKEIGTTGFRGLSSELSGVSPEALDAWAKGGAGREAIRTAKGSRALDEKINMALENPEEIMPEGMMVAKALEGKTLDPSKYGKGLDAYMSAMGVNGVLSPVEEAATPSLKSWRDFFAAAGEKGEIPANELRKKRSELDLSINYSDPNMSRSSAALIEKGLKQTAREIREDLKSVAGSDYTQVMETWARKLASLKELEHLLGATKEARMRKSESILDNIFNRNKTEAQNIVGRFDDVFGTGYLDEARNNWYAKQLGLDMSLAPEMRQPAIMPMQYTGRSGLGLAFSGAEAGAGDVLKPFRLASYLAMSPRTATSTLEQMYNPSVAAKTGQAATRQAKNIARTSQTKDE